MDSVEKIFQTKVGRRSMDEIKPFTVSRRSGQHIAVSRGICHGIINFPRLSPFFSQSSSNAVPSGRTALTASNAVPIMSTWCLLRDTYYQAATTTNLLFHLRDTDTEQCQARSPLAASRRPPASATPLALP